MARAKKTFKVETLKDRVNGCLRDIQYTNAEKSVMCMMLENVLHETNNYKGYNNLYWLNTGHSQWLKDGEPEGESKNLYISNNGKEEYSRIYY